MLEDGFADIIGKARFGKDWSLSGLSDRSLIATSRITALEEEALPKPEEVAALGRALDLDVEKLQQISDEAWTPNLKSPFLPAPEGNEMKDMVHVIEGKIGDYPVNGYFFIDWKRRECLLFDTGYSPEMVIGFLEEHGLRLVAICLTHAHPDHIGGLEKIQFHSNAPAYIHRNEDLGRTRLRQKVFVEENMTIPVGNFTATARQTPGHTDGGVTYFIEASTGISRCAAFVGDALFAGSMGRAKAPETYSTLLGSVKEVILSFPPETLLFPGHGSVTNVEAEKRHNPFFL